MLGPGKLYTSPTGSIRTRSGTRWNADWPSARLRGLSDFDVGPGVLVGAEGLSTGPTPAVLRGM